MEDKAKRYMGLARKAGLLALGEDRCMEALGEGKAKLLLLAADASPGATKKAQAGLRGHRAVLDTLPWEREELGAALGKPGCGMICFTDPGLAASFAAAMAEELPQWADTAALLSRREDKMRRRKAAPRKHERGGA